MYPLCKLRPLPVANLNTCFAWMNRKAISAFSSDSSPNNLSRCLEFFSLVLWKKLASFPYSFSFLSFYSVICTFWGCSLSLQAVAPLGMVD